MRFHLLKSFTLVAVLAGTASAQTKPSTQPVWQSGQINPIVRTGTNRAVSLTINNVTVSNQYGKLTAPAGRAFLVLGTEWTNHIALTSINGKNAATAYKVPDLRDNAYLVADGITVWQLATTADGAPGVLTRRAFTVSRPGESVTGNLVFDVPARVSPASLSFRFYDFAHGHMMIDVAGSMPQATPKFEAQKNEVVEAAVYDMRRVEAFHGVGAPAGLAYVVVDLRARSTMATEADASAFDPGAQPGARAVVGTVADWKESRKYLQMIVDGEFAWPAVDQTDLIKEPRFLPDLFTGGNVVFLVPEKHTSLELRCDFPNARLTSGKVIRPAGFTTLLEGKRPALPAPKSIAGVKDEFFDISIVEQAVAGEFAGIRAPAGRKFLVINVTVQNIGKQQEFFQTVEQLKHVDEKGAASPLDKATYSGVRRPLELIYIPSGEQRSFQLAYQVPAPETKPRLAYTSATKGASKMLDLPAIAGGPQADAGAPVTQPGVTQPTKTPTVAKTPALDLVTRAAPVAAKQSRTARGIEGIGMKAEEVNLAIDRGSKALWELIRNEDLKGTGKFGSKPEHVLAALALVNAGAHKKIPEFDATLRGFLKDVQPRKLRTYEAGLLAMLIEAYGDGEFGPKMEEVARHLLETQGTKGTWNYVIQLPDAIYKKVEVPTSTGSAAAGATPDEVPTLLVRRNTNTNPDADNSNTQYAILGLNAASRTGIKVLPDVWRLTLQTTLERQENSGGWSYREKGQSPAYGSMTAAGICAVALCRHELGAADPGKDDAIEAGLGWLTENFSVAANPKHPEWEYYYIYSIERVGRILDTEFIGQYEWYPLGAEHLVGQQKSGGLWVGKGYEVNPRLSSSFALLFLTRATPSLNLKQKLRPSAAPPVVAAPPPATKPVVIAVEPPPRPSAEKPVVVAVAPPPVVAKPTPVEAPRIEETRVEETVVEPAYEPAPREAVLTYEADLNPHGEWIEVKEYGRCWTPRGRPAAWRPYTVGHWVNTSEGWCWNSEGDEVEWGAVTYHYGRWYEEPRRGWIWVPGTTWAPAWVSWREGGGYSGWAALSPRVGYRREIDAVYVDRHVADDRYVFVDSRYVGEPRVQTHVVNNTTTIINQTTNITNITVVNNRVVNRGVSVEHVERASGKRYETTRVAEVTTATEARRLRSQGKSVAYVPKTVKTADADYRARVERRNQEADKAERERTARVAEEAAKAKHDRAVRRAEEARIAAEKAKQIVSKPPIEKPKSVQADEDAKQAERERVRRRTEEARIAAEKAKQPAETAHDRAVRRAAEEAAAKAAAEKKRKDGSGTPAKP